MAVRVGIVGLGYWGVNYVRVFSELSDVTLAAICDQRPERLETLTQRFRGVRAEVDPQRLFDDPNIDAVVIATTASTHFDVARAALLAGKDILVEKPLALRTQECVELTTTADKLGRVLMVGHTFLYNPGVRKMKECMAGIGDLYYLHATRTNMGPIRRDVNVVWDLVPHDLAIFAYLLGRHPEWVSATGSRLLGAAQEDVAFIVLGYPNDIVGHVHASWADPNKVRQVVVVGSEQRIVFDDLSVLERIRVIKRGVRVQYAPEAQSFGEFLLLANDGDMVSPYVPPDEPLKLQCREFLRAVTTDKRPFTTGHDAAMVTQTICAINESLSRRGAPVPVVSIEAIA